MANAFDAKNFDAKESKDWSTIRMNIVYRLGKQDNVVAVANKCKTEYKNKM